MIIYLLLYSFFLFISKNSTYIFISTILSAMNGFFLAYLFEKIVNNLVWDNFILVGLVLLSGTIFATIFEKFMLSKSLIKYSIKHYTYCTYELLIICIVIYIKQAILITDFMYGISLYLCISYIIPEKTSKLALFYSIILGFLGFFVGIVVFLQ